MLTLKSQPKKPAKALKAKAGASGRRNSETSDTDESHEEVDSYFDFNEGDFQSSPRVGGSAKPSKSGLEEVSESSDDDFELGGGALLVVPMSSCVPLAIAMCNLRVALQMFAGLRLSVTPTDSCAT